QTLDERARPPRSRVFDGETGEARDLGAVASVEGRTDQLEALLDREERLALLRVGCHRDDQLVEDAERAVDHVQVSVGERVEAPGIDGDLRVGDLIADHHTISTVTTVSP